jgi:hypothetical protein
MSEMVSYDPSDRSARVHSSWRYCKGPFRHRKHVVLLNLEDGIPYLAENEVGYG